MRCAVIDLGTNTFNLLVADKGPENFLPILNHRIGVALGMGGIGQSIITQDARNRALDALQTFKQVCYHHGVKRIYAVGTSALRDATNTSEWLEKVLNQLNLKIRIISGEMEAEYIFSGVAYVLPKFQPAVIMDIGGGSTEFITIEQSKIKERQSCNIGLTRMFDTLTLSDPLIPSDCHLIESWLDSNAPQLDLTGVEVLIGASGSFETFYELLYRKHYPNSYELQELVIESLMEVLQELTKSSLEERKSNAFVLPIRQRLSHLAALKTQWFIKKHHFRRIFVTSASLKEGIMLSPWDDWEEYSNLL